MAVNLAHAASEAGLNTLLCDLDPQGASGFYYRVKPSRKLQDDRFFTDVKKFTSAIKASDYRKLDILPANMSFREFDVFLSRMKNSRSRLKKALRSVDSDYDLIILDCPPNLSTLSENVFRAADAILVPVVPTTLSERTFEQITDFFKKEGLAPKKLVPFFSMVQGQKALHRDTMKRMRKSYRKRFVDTVIPFSTEIEKMGLHRAPVATYAARKTGGRAYHDFWSELSQRLKLV